MKSHRLARSRIRLTLLLALLICSNTTASAAPASPATIHIDTPMPPPFWALQQRELIRANTAACRQFFEKYLDGRGYLRCIERWGAADGPDDAIENVADWPILHALGASDEVLRMYKKAWEGHLKQFTQARTVEVPFAREGMYYREFPAMFDWYHIGEFLRVFNLQGLSDPQDARFRERVRRYAGFYMNEDPEAPNYDPEHKIIRSYFNGSRGPLLRKTTGVDWAGDPFEPFEGAPYTYQMLVERYQHYSESLGDHPMNLGATTLAANAYLLTGEEKYRRWALEYVDAWVSRTRENQGIIPSNIGLDGVIGGATEGKWYGGAYGWNFSLRNPRTGAVSHPNRVGRGLIGFGNAYLLTGDRRYIETWTGMMDKINSHRGGMYGKPGAQLGATVGAFPRMYGDRGWYAFTPGRWSEGALECYFWSGDPKDRERVPENDWIQYLQGQDPEYPWRALRADFENIRRKIAAMRKDPSTPRTRLADGAMRYNPVSIASLREQMLAGIDPGRGGGLLHCRLRYFDPQRRRAGIPEDVAALVDTMTDTQVAVTLVNVNQSEAREVLVQMGAYGEHQCRRVVMDGRSFEISGSWFEVHLSPGAGARLLIETDRYANQPSLLFPWDQGR